MKPHVGGAMRAGATAACLLLAACSEDDRFPVGVDQIPPPVDTIQEIVLEPVFAESFESGTLERGFGTLLLGAHALPDPAGYESRILVRFGLATTTATVDSARVRLVTPALDPDTIAFRVHRITASWDEEEVSWEERAFGSPWATPGGDFDPTPLAEGRLSGDSTTFELPDSLVQRWVDGSGPNDGLIVLLDTPASAARIIAATPLGLPTLEGPRLYVGVTSADTSQVDRPAATQDAYILDYAGEIVPGLGVGLEPRLRSILKFDISVLPEDASINLAELRVRPAQIVTPVDSLLIELARVASPFLGDETVFAGDSIDVEVVRAGGDLVFAHPRLASLVRAWQIDSTLNLGLGLTIQSTSGNVGFTVLAGPDAPAEERPRLRLIYTPALTPDLGRRR